jgi:hypothetical protein
MVDHGRLGASNCEKHTFRRIFEKPVKLIEYRQAYQSVQKASGVE